ncbi:MAG: hypothetical protein WD670_04625, partial [Actinomycetota bacterium]
GATPAPGAASVQALPVGDQPVTLDPVDFSTTIDNPYWPMTPGDVRVFRETDSAGADLKVVVTVTSRTEVMANGVTARVVRDVVTDHGEPVEVTDDWYAQDSAGNVWYLGEATAEYKHGKVSSTAGSFEVGVDGAQAGIAMPADPAVGQAYRQEYYAGEAEDAGEVFSLHEKVEVPFGRFDDAVMTKDTTPIEPDVLEYKFYVKDIGPVLALGISGGGAREELVSFRRGG